jgi:type II secretory pathway pseudopilin PulG
LIELLINMAILMVIVGIAIPTFRRALTYSQLDVTLGAIRAIHTAQVQYCSQYGKYAASLTELGPPNSGPVGPAGAGLIDANLASGSKGCYRFTMTGNGAGYAISVLPEANCQGGRAYYSDESMTVREDPPWNPRAANIPAMK